MDEGRSAARKIIIASGEGERGSGDLPPGTLPRHANALARAEEEHSRASLREDLPAHSRFTRASHMCRVALVILEVVTCSDFRDSSWFSFYGPDEKHRKGV